jgi:hypothetical protein
MRLKHDKWGSIFNNFTYVEGIQNFIFHLILKNFGTFELIETILVAIVSGRFPANFLLSVLVF